MLATIPLFVVAVASLQPTGGSFAPCKAESRAVQHPTDDNAYLCVYRTAQRTGEWAEAERFLSEWVASLPPGDVWNPWLRLTLAHLHARAGPQRALGHYREVANRFADIGDAKGEVLTRINLARILRNAGKIGEAGLEIERSVAAAERSTDSSDRARAVIESANFEIVTGGDLFRAFYRLRQLELSGVVQESNRGLLRQYLGTLYRASFSLGRFGEAIQTGERLLAVLDEDDSPFDAASVTFNVANARLRQLLYRPTPGGRDEVRALADKALELALRTDNRRSETFSRRLIAEVLPDDAAGRAAALAHIERCLELAERMDAPERRTECLWTHALRLATHDPEAALDRAHEAVTLAHDSGTPLARTLAWRALARTSWQANELDRAANDALAAIDAIEALRRRQEAEGGRAELFTDFTGDYYRLSGELLARGTSNEQLALAFEVIERMRARVLLESLDASGGLAHLPADHELMVSRRDVLAKLSVVQRLLVDPSFDASERAAALLELDRLELDEQEVQRELRALSSDFALREPAFASLDAIQSALEPDEAMLSFQLGLATNIFDEPGGGSWTMLITRDDVHVIPIPDRVALEPKVAIFLGLLTRGNESLVRASTALYADLLARAVELLPDSIHQIVLIPDGALTQLPFDVLREDVDQPPVVERFELSSAPSATLWLRWRRQSSVPAAVAAVAFADPTLGAGTLADERALTLREGLQLGALPYARDEGRAVVRHLHGNAELLMADDASEHALKSLSLDRYDILHFAAHAVTDIDNPERSAVVLTPGSDSEDGLLQIREIRELDLDGKVVVLSACSSATGKNLNGEGVLSLARAFFQAGARAVIGSQWVQRDDEAAYLFDRFYRALGRGRSLAAALASAKRDAMRDDLPVSAWAGLALYGDGALTPIEPPPPSSTGAVALVLLAIVLTSAGLVYRARRD